MENGYYISVYSHVGNLEYLYDIALRHDHSISLWHKKGKAIDLVQVWELERFSGQKHHMQPFYDRRHFECFLQERLQPLGINLSQIKDIWGTPGLNTSPVDYWSGYGEFPQHNLAHLFSALMVNKRIFDTECIVALAVDGGPDNLEDTECRQKNYYTGAVTKQGEISLFSVPSAAPLWAFLRMHFGLKEGSLMALAGACNGKVIPANTPPPPIYTISDSIQADSWFKSTLVDLDRLCSAKNEVHFDTRFTPAESRAAMMTKLVQTYTEMELKQTIENALVAHNVNARECYLAMAGGAALNCPANTYLMNEFGFKGFLAPPCVNDSGLSMGLGLLRFYKDNKDFQFKLSSPYLGSMQGATVEELLKGGEYDQFIESTSQFTTSQFAEDLLAEPLVWFQGQGEVGPRALGHRSLLADPRFEKSREILNRIKQRQWWRPVAPIILESCMNDWFENSFPSPYMLQAFTVKPEKRHRVPAICHLNGTARAQTLTGDQNLELYQAIEAFYTRTGVPMLCNTSLNDRAEPILNSVEAAIVFALKKRLRVVYADGVRLELTNYSAYLKGRERTSSTRSFQPSPKLDLEQERKRVNPLGFSREELVLKQQNPRLRTFDHQDPQEQPKLRKLLRRIRAQFSKRVDFQFIDLFHDLGGTNISSLPEDSNRSDSFLNHLEEADG
ncbi:carbamoyltransferase C-terminal domain-containing protein [Flexibacterium corallicola]|uniref:carbamoyltransferase C-terminal domain-containing protein n=1 Tax=Flexibacterium corallicola TaxID=3037259 RepID=UPI00286F72F9|nr:carbamoyltransferase C-terminal domain-containing protein [Pseudovibrio sp. M1P-2-3]